MLAARDRVLWVPPVKERKCQTMNTYSSFIRSNTGFSRVARILTFAGIALTTLTTPVGANGASRSIADGNSADRQLPASADHSLLFVQNNGQFDPRAHFQLRGAGGTWWFTDE